MAYLVALVILLSLLSLLNLLFTVGVVRRLRDQPSAADQRADAEPPRPMGTEATDFVADTIGDGPVSLATLNRHTLVGFFTPGCKPCAAAVPQFLEYVESQPYGRDRVLAVISRGPDDDEVAEYAKVFNRIGRVVVEDPRGAVQTAFAVDGIPAFGVVDGRTITVATRKVGKLPAGVPA
ncbi:TlpA family protein disulfide reductase [Plantactinospora sp. S1510]|uniref:TlpA family protein disulfide reductase n=1 Tax=Plantactinospora alkalitolerans TaxID=2789879 RepID=A0ABS0H701_9ACTN|nr:TlpA disulfide reductase family protein [Plantactinospora alkalitolerans]MBF9134218.1 TlpA family protein disulfide reductase [Plantactinospora alkalitolerans]